MIKDTEKKDQSKVHLASEIPPLLFSELNDESADSGSDMVRQLLSNRLINLNTMTF